MTEKEWLLDIKESFDSGCKILKNGTDSLSIRDVKFLIQQAETLEKIKEIYYSDVYDVGDLLREMSKVFGGKESPSKNLRR